MAEKQHAEKEPKDVHALHVIFLLMILLPTIVVNAKLLATFVVFLRWRLHLSQHPSKGWQVAVCYYAFNSFSISLTIIKNQMVRGTPFVC